MTDSRSQQVFMRRAIELSLANVHAGRGGPFGALIVKDGAIIAEGTNLVTSRNDPTAHAEVVAIRQACEKLETFVLRGCEIYSSCEPCPMCLCAIRWARLDAIFYANTRRDAARIGFDDARMYQELNTPPDRRSIPAIRVLGNEARVAFDVWESKVDKIHY